jgi:cytosine permease
MEKPSPAEKGVPWYKSTAPIYAGISLWMVVHLGVLSYWSFAVYSQPPLASVPALVFAALISYFAFYRVPALLGMKTGYRLHTICSSTYGVRGSFVIPGLLMCTAPFAWLYVCTIYSAGFILEVMNASGNSVVYGIVVTIWIALAGFVGTKGLRCITRVSTFLLILPLLIILFMFFMNLDHIGDNVSHIGLSGFMTITTRVLAFFAFVGIAGASVGMTHPNRRGVQLTGLCGIVAPIIVAGAMLLMAFSGALLNSERGYSMGEWLSNSFTGIGVQGGLLSRVALTIFAMAGFPVACFCSFVAATSIETMFPKANKTVLFSVGAIAAIILMLVALSAPSLCGLPIDLIIASLFPVCGSLAADYLLSGRRWAGPRRGINKAGCIAWAVGFVVAIPSMVGFSFISPAPVTAFVIGFVLYYILAKAGFEPPVVDVATSVLEGTLREAPRKGISTEHEGLKPTEDRQEKSKKSRRRTKPRQEVTVSGSKSRPEQAKEVPDTAPQEVAAEERAAESLEPAVKHRAAKVPEYLSKKRKKSGRRAKPRERVSTKGSNARGEQTVDVPVNGLGGKREKAEELPESGRPVHGEDVTVGGLGRKTERTDQVTPDVAQDKTEEMDKGMENRPERNEVFISYSRQDKIWLDKLQIHLKVAVRKKEMSIWTDEKIPTGAKWKDQIEAAMSRAKVAVLLVSPNFLASDFVARNELPPLLDAAKNEGLTIVWIPISSSMYAATDIAKYQAAHDPSQPLDTLSNAGQNAAFVEICKKIQAASKT